MLISMTIGGTTKRSTTGQHPVELDWNQLPDESQQFIIRYGLKQYLADGMAGAANVAEASEGVAKRLKKLAEADFTRTRGEGKDKPDTVEGLALKMAKEFIRKTAKERNVKLEKEQVEAAAAKLVDAQPKWKKEAEKQIKAKQSLFEEEDDFLADLLSGEDEETEGDETPTS